MEVERILHLRWEHVDLERGLIFSKREPSTMLKTDERSIHLGLGCEGNSSPNQVVGTRNRVFREGDKLEVAVKTAAGGSRACPRARDRRPNRSDAIFRKTETAFQQP